MKDDSSHDAKLQPTKNFLNRDAAMNKMFYERIQIDDIQEHLWTNKDSNVVEMTTEEGGR